MITIRILNFSIKILSKIYVFTQRESDMEKTQLAIEKNQKEIKEHGDYSFPVNISEEAIQAYEQNSFLWHWHPEVELTFILSGEMEYHVNNETYLLSEGEGLFGNSNTLHAGFMKDGKDCSYVSITFHPRFLYGYESSILQSKYVDPITSNDSWHSLKFEKQTGWHQSVILDMREIYRLSQEKPADYELQVHMLLLDIWQKLFRCYSQNPAKKQQPQKHLQRLREIISYIQDNYNQDLTLDNIADHVNICKNECCRFFKKHMGMTIFEYILFLRIQNSLPLLKRGESVTKTASMVGFSSPAYFGQIFRRYMKCTPKEYKGL